MIKNLKPLVILIWLLLIAVIVTFWITTFFYAYNFPYYDDFENIILFVFNYIKTNGLHNKIHLLFEQNFEHRVIFAKLLTLLIFNVTGQVNIKLLIILGDLSLLGTVLMFYKYLTSKQLSLLGLFTIVCVLFQVQHYEDSISWATCSLQHAPCIFFSICSFYLALNKRSLFLSGILALLALFTSANGLSTIAILLIISAFTLPWKKNIVPAAILILVTIIHLTTLTLHSGSMLDHITGQIGTKTVLLISFAGQLADSNITGNIAPSVILGLFFLFPVVIVCWKVAKKKQSDITQLQWLSFLGIITLLFVGFLIVFARGMEADFLGYRMDRYKIYSAFFGVFAIAFYDQYWSKFLLGIPVRLAMAGVAFLFCISSYYLYYESIINYRRIINANQINYNWSQTIYYPPIYKNTSDVNYFGFAKENFFTPKKGRIETIVDQIDWKLKTDSIVTERSWLAGKLSITKNDKLIINGQEPDELYVVAVDSKSDKPQYFFTVNNNFNRSVKKFYTTFHKSVGDGFQCFIYKEKLQTGNYDLRLLSLKNGALLGVNQLGKLDIE